jgi:hypothetical protein
LAGSIGDYCPKAISGLAVTLDEASAAFKRAYDTMREKADFRGRGERR